MTTVKGESMIPGSRLHSLTCKKYTGENYCSCGVDQPKPKTMQMIGFDMAEGPDKSCIAVRTKEGFSFIREV